MHFHDEELRGMADDERAVDILVNYGPNEGLEWFLNVVPVEHSAGCDWLAFREFGHSSPTFVYVPLSRVVQLVQRERLADEARP